MNFKSPLTLLVVLSSLLAVACGVSTPYASSTKSDVPIERIDPQKAREMVSSGQALLVCAYSDSRCKSILLENALLRSELEKRIVDLPRSQPIIFYCG